MGRSKHAQRRTRAARGKASGGGRRGKRRGRAAVDPLDYLAGRRRRWWAWAAVIALAGIGLIAADHRGWLLYEGGAMGRYDGQRVRVTRVLDGDTLEVAVPDGDRPVTRVRLWGVDAPERAHGDRPAEPGAMAATRFVRHRVLDRTVRLQLEPHRLRGDYGRLLAFVSMPGTDSGHSPGSGDGTELADAVGDVLLLNEALLIMGLAETDERWSHRHLDRFRLLALQAERQTRGIWGPLINGSEGD